MPVLLASSGKKKPLTINPENLSEHGIYIYTALIELPEKNQEALAQSYAAQLPG